jgi:hypothetical protein
MTNAPPLPSLSCSSFSTSRQETPLGIQPPSELSAIFFELRATHATGPAFLPSSTLKESKTNENRRSNLKNILSAALEIVDMADFDEEM